MARNNKTIVQSSDVMCQSWRANCDVQVLVYNSNPENPDPYEISNVVDYIIGYVCKGSHTFTQEYNQLKQLIDSASEETGDQYDLVRLSRRLLNRCSTNRLISKQESLVLLLDLDLVLSSDRFDHINVSSTSIGNTEGGCSIISQYKARKEMPNMTLHEYYHWKKGDQKKGKKKNSWNIPHYTGASTKASFPPKYGYVKTQFLIHKPWKHKFEINEDNWLQNFGTFLSKDNCPSLVKLAYNRAVCRHFDKRTTIQPVAKGPELDVNISEEDQEYMQLIHKHIEENGDIDTGQKLDRGELYEWDQEPKVRHVVKLK